MYEKEISRNVGRALWLGFEHEAMHLETLLYMLLQTDKTLPPTSTIPDFKKMAEADAAARTPNEWFRIPKQTIHVGLAEEDDGSLASTHFGWYVLVALSLRTMADYIF